MDRALDARRGRANLTAAPHSVNSPSHDRASAGAAPLDARSALFYAEACSEAESGRGREGVDETRTWIAYAASGIEALAVILMVVIIAVVTVRFLFTFATHGDAAYEDYRISVGRSLLLGLELLVAADIIRTVALDSTLQNILTLGALVIVRTFLGWTLNVEIEGRWPWQPKPKEP